jgi:ribonuclease HI
MDNKPNTLEVYTDGSCTKTGAGTGVYFPNKELPDISQTLDNGRQTNQRAELYAIYLALYNICLGQNTSLVFDYINLYSDSIYSIKCCTEWPIIWEKNNWQNSKKSPVLNTDIIKPILELVQKYKIKVNFIHVKAHTNKQDTHSLNNNIADKLAKQSSYKN